MQTYFTDNWQLLSNYWNRESGFIVTIDDPSQDGEVWSSQSLYFAVKYNQSVALKSNDSLYVRLPYKLRQYLDQTSPHCFRKTLVDLNAEDPKNDLEKVFQGILYNQDVRLKNHANDFFMGEESLDFKTLELAQIFKNITPKLSSNTQEKLKESFRAFKNRKSHRVYGSDTMFGANADQIIKPSEFDSLQESLAQYLDCGTGHYLSANISRAVFFTRIHSFAKSSSGLSHNFVDRCIELYKLGIAPVIPTRGSLGASGDLISMAPLARLLIGDRVSFWNKDNILIENESITSYSNLEPYRIESREVLATVNGLSCVTTYLGCLLTRVLKQINWVFHSIATTHLALGGTSESFSRSVNNSPLRLFKGQSFAAKKLRYLMKDSVAAFRDANRAVQDEYSLRCIPQIMGPIFEILRQSQKWIETELNSVSDNPVVGSNGVCLSGGNFFGGYVVWSADHLLQVMAKVGELLEQQTFLIVDGKHGLPLNLANRQHGLYNHGLKGVHQLCNALSMELHRQSLPAKAFTRPCESHNQDVVSNAMNAAHQVEQQLAVFTELVSAHTLLSRHAFAVSKAKLGENSPLLPWYNKLIGVSPELEHDRSLRSEIKIIVELLNDL